MLNDGTWNTIFPPNTLSSQTGKSWPPPIRYIPFYPFGQETWMAGPDIPYFFYGMEVNTGCWGHV